MRSHYVYVLPLSYSNSDTSCRDNCEFSSHIDLTQNKTSVQHTFNTCKWLSCTADSGGGIFFQSSSSEATLTVTDSQFLSCKAIDTRGGGIHIIGSVTLTLKSTLFHSCTAVSNGDFGAGGVELDSLTSHPLISQCSFVSCISGNDGGGLCFLSGTFSQDSLALEEDKFISCQSQNSDNGGGGASEIWMNTQITGISNTLFVSCSSLCVGGALAMSVNPRTYSSFINFCFFTSNTSPAGNDALIHFDNSIQWRNVFSRSFTTTTENSLVQNYPDKTPLTFSESNNWLPQTNSNRNSIAAGC